jgi:hypothetical protein
LWGGRREVPQARGSFGMTGALWGGRREVPQSRSSFGMTGGVVGRFVGGAQV